MNPSHTLHSFASDLTPATALAAALGWPGHGIDRRSFPDGESLVRVVPPEAAAIVYCRLDRPNEKLIELLLAADALTIGSQRPVLVAPYLPYMRQDVALREGEAVSQKIIGRLLGSAFSIIITVEPHLHRSSSLAAVLPSGETIALGGAPALAALVDKDGGRPLLVGPDTDSLAHPSNAVSLTRLLAGALERTLS
jgi:ribose-phosphate pyrophosphokinase